MVLTDETLSELERLDREATPGPWSNGAAYGARVVDAHIIRAARNALPELIAEVRRLREAMSGCQEAFNLLRQRIESSRRSAAFGMRERAASLAEQAVIGIDLHDGMSRLVDGIRALPLPGEGP